MQDESPMKSEFNKLGEYILISLCFVIATMIEFAIVLFINQERKENTKRCPVKSRKFSNEMHAMASTEDNLGLSWSTLRIRGLGGSKDYNGQSNEKMMKIKVGFFGGLSLIKKIDYLSFILLSTMYLLYNMVHLTQSTQSL